MVRYNGPKAPRRCAQADCRERHPCPKHPWGWEGYRREDSKHPLPSNWQSLVKETWDDYRGLCGNCGAPGHSVDHIVPRSQGGTSDKSNLQLLCERCHNTKSRKERLWRGRQKGRGLSG